MNTDNYWIEYYRNPSYSKLNSRKFHCYCSNKHEKHTCIFVYRSNWICNWWNNYCRLKYANTNLYVLLYLHGSKNFCLYCNICSTHQTINIQDYIKFHMILSSFDTFLLRTRLLISYLTIFLLHVPLNFETRLTFPIYVLTWGGMLEYLLYITTFSYVYLFLWWLVILCHMAIYSLIIII